MNLESFRPTSTEVTALGAQAMPYSLSRMITQGPPLNAPKILQMNLKMNSMTLFLLLMMTM
jgi:hypothetical protein